jgi:hypothetical protein
MPDKTHSHYKSSDHRDRDLSAIYEENEVQESSFLDRTTDLQKHLEHEEKRTDSKRSEAVSRSAEESIRHDSTSNILEDVGGNTITTNVLH